MPDPRSAWTRVHDAIVHDAIMPESPVRGWRISDVAMRKAQRRSRSLGLLA
jgi:hypothetical protein